MKRTKQKTTNYYYITTYYNNDSPIVVSAHVVRASSEREAVKIAEQHGIALPFHSKKVKRRNCQKLDDEGIHQDFVARRRQGVGGYVWYEDENSELQKETNGTNTN